MKRVYKYPFAIQDAPQAIETPGDGTLMHVGLDPGGAPCVWLLVDPEAPPTTTYIVILGTGHAAMDHWQPIGSFNQGPFMWHVFAIPEVETISETDEIRGRVREAQERRRGQRS